MKKILIFSTIAALVIGSFSAFTSLSENPVKLIKNVIYESKIPFSIPKSLDWENPQVVVNAAIAVTNFLYDNDCMIGVIYGSDESYRQFDKPKSMTVAGIKESVNSVPLLNVEEISTITLFTPFGDSEWVLTKEENIAFYKYVNIFAVEVEKATSLPDLYKRMKSHATKDEMRNAEREFVKWRKQLP